MAGVLRGRILGLRCLLMYGTLGSLFFILTLASEIPALNWRFHPDGSDEARLLPSPVRSDGSRRERPRRGGCISDKEQ